MLRDRLVYGVNHNQIQQKLLSEGKSIKHCYFSLISNQPVIVNKPVSTASTSQQGRTSKYIKNNRKCKPDKLGYRCSGNHKPETCSFKDRECFYCKVKGHTIKVCRKKLKRSKDETHQTHQLPHQGRSMLNVLGRIQLKTPTKLTKTTMTFSKYFS